MREYLFGVVTLPVAAVVVFVCGALLSRSSCTRVWCDCGWSAHPSQSRMPWWLADNLRWKIHTLRRQHRKGAKS